MPLIAKRDLYVQLMTFGSAGSGRWTGALGFFAEGRSDQGDAAEVQLGLESGGAEASQGRADLQSAHRAWLRDRPEHVLGGPQTARIYAC